MANVGTALVVGASRGLGLGLAGAYAERGWEVIATERAGGRSTPLHALAERYGSRLRIETVDIARGNEIEALAGRLSKSRLDLLLVNAGVLVARGAPASQVSDADWAHIMATNALGPMRLIEALEGSLAEDATVAAMSSQLGSVAGNTSGDYEVYRASKAALNTLLRSYSARAARGRTVLAVSPGWVRTDMGGSGASIDVATSVNGIVQTLESRHGRGGNAFVDYRNLDLPW